MTTTNPPSDGVARDLENAATLLRDEPREVVQVGHLAGSMPHLGSMMAAIAAAGMVSGGPLMLEIDPVGRDPLDDLLGLSLLGASMRRRHEPAPKRPQPKLKPPVFQARSQPSTAPDTRDPKYLHSHARRAALARASGEAS